MESSKRQKTDRNIEPDVDLESWSFIACDTKHKPSLQVPVNILNIDSSRQCLELILDPDYKGLMFTKKDWQRCSHQGAPMIRFTVRADQIEMITLSRGEDNVRTIDVWSWERREAPFRLLCLNRASYYNFLEKFFELGQFLILEEEDFYPLIRPEKLAEIHAMYVERRCRFPKMYINAQCVDKRGKLPAQTEPTFPFRKSTVNKCLALLKKQYTIRPIRF